MKKIFIVILVFFTVSSVFPAEYIDGRIKLVLNENTGRFSLYYMTDIAKEEFSPLFFDQDPRSSFLSVIVNNKTYKMGETSVFKTRIAGTPSSPSLIFESSFLVVVKNFSFIKTESSSLTNGVLITITITNKSEQPVDAGIRLLIDTNLLEKNSPHFFTNSRHISSETIIDGSSGDKYWVSKNSKVMLQGSIQSRHSPDMIHFANWKRLNDASWKISPMPGRNFNLLPSSVDDSAVCYYYDIALLPKDGSRTASLSLTGDLSGDDAGRANDSTQVTQRNKAELAESIRADLALLRELISNLNEHINSGAFISDEELTAVNLLILRIKSKYSIP